MSLLMEALRKAEQAKSKARNENSDSHDENLLPEQSGPMADDHSEAVPRQNENIDTVEFDASVEPPLEEETPEAVIEDTHSEADPAEELIEPEEVVSPRMSLSEVDAARPYVEARESLQDEEPEDYQEELSEDEFSEQESAFNLTPDNESVSYQAAADVTTRQTANSMFQAKQDKSQASKNKMVMFLGLLMLFPILGGTYWFLASNQDEMVFQGVDANAGDYRNRSFSDNVEPGVVAQSSEAGSIPEPDITGDSQVPETSLEIPAGQSASSSDVATITPSQSSVEQASTVMLNARNSQQQNVVAQSAEPVIRLTRSSTSVQENSQLQEAYVAYRRGDIENAKQQYQSVLNQDVNNTNALSGLATIYRQEGDVVAARSMYSRMLNLNPEDPVARAGLLESSASSDPVEMENDLKMMQERHPEVASIPFALGNFYATQGRWSEAQSAYFNAISIAQSAGQQNYSPDFAFNLAVSLERLNQKRLALEYYQKARELLKMSSAGFSEATLNQRLRQLEQEL